MTDTIKPSAPGAIARLRGLGLRPVLYGEGVLRRIVGW